MPTDADGSRPGRGLAHAGTAMPGEGGRRRPATTPGEPRAEVDGRPESTDGCEAGEWAWTAWNREKENGRLPGAICFYTDGVRMVCEGSPVLEALRSLEAKGVHLIACKTCLDALGLAERHAIGVVGRMGDIVAAQLAAGKVITL